jgi:hypothetical protein
VTGDTSQVALERQYERVLEEYRFQVQLNWDRAKHYLTFNTLLFGAAVALSKDASCATYAGVCALLFIAGCNSWFGQFAVAKGQEYYRAIRTTKTTLEVALDLGAHAIATTPGMKRDHDIEPAGTPATGARRLGKITQQIRLLLAVIGVLAFIGSVCAGYAAARNVAPDSTAR